MVLHTNSCIAPSVSTQLLFFVQLTLPAIFRSGWNHLSSSLLSKNINIKVYRTVILPVVLYGRGTWSLTVREEDGLRVFENGGC